MTYGEAIIKIRDSAPIENGLINLNMRKLRPKPRMEKCNASEYYNKKLRRYWMQQLDSRIPLQRREKILDYLLGNTKEIK